MSERLRSGLQNRAQGFNSPPDLLGLNNFRFLFSFKEQKIVAKRLKINDQKLADLVKKKLKIIKINQPLAQLKKQYQTYAADPHDAHIVAATQKTKAKFLLTYNQRHFKKEKIKRDFSIMIFTPAQFLQYLRSQN